MSASFQHYFAVPSAIISDGIVNVPLYAVTSLTLSSSYHLPPIGSSGERAIVDTHDDTLQLSGVFVGPERFAWKLALEDMAESSKRGGFVAGLTAVAESLKGFNRRAARWPDRVTDQQIRALAAQLREVRP